MNFYCVLVAFWLRETDYREQSLFPLRDIVEQKEHVSESQNRLSRGNVMRES